MPEFKIIYERTDKNSGFSASSIFGPKQIIVTSPRKPGSKQALELVKNSTEESFSRGMYSYKVLDIIEV